jgi:oligopeptide transport system substrate-binding protein
MRSKFPCATALLATALACAGFAAGGCSRQKTAVEEGNLSQTLHVGNVGEPGELDPHVINAAPDYQIITALFEGLLNADPATMEPLPGVAERWEVSADGLTYTFHLRNDARWSNGDPLTAEDFLYSFRRALSPALGSQYTFLFHAVRGADEFAAGKLADFSAVGFAAPDARTVVVSLARPTPYFLGIVAGNPVWYPVHRATIERHGRIDQRGTGWTRPENFVGNGPFVLKDWRPTQLIVVEKSATYWDAAHVRLHAVHFHAIDNGDTQELAFRSGQLHVTTLVPAAKATAYLAAHSPLLLRTPQLWTAFINVNTARPPLNDYRIRLALAQALDRVRFAERIGPAQMAPAYSIVPEGMPGYRSVVRIKEDVASARALLAEAGFPNAANFPTLELSCQTGDSTDLVQAIQEAWRTNLGIHVSIVRRESRTHWDTLHLKQYDLALAGWSGDYPDASSFLDLWRSDGGWNFTNWRDAHYDELLAGAANQSNPATRLKQLQIAESRLTNEMPVIPLSYNRDVRLIQASVHGWSTNPLQRPDYKGVWLSAPK